MPSSTMQSTDSLLERVRQGSRSALNSLLALYRPELLRNARARLPGARAWKQDASDLVQETLLLAAARSGEFKGRSRPEFGAWMRGILKNVILHHERHFGRKKRDRKLEKPLAAVGGGPGSPPRPRRRSWTGSSGTRSGRN